MGFSFRLADYPRYLERVGEATYVDVTRRADPACVPAVFGNLASVHKTYGAPWIVQLWTKALGHAVVAGDEVLAALHRAGTTVTAQLTVTGLGGTPFEPNNTPPAFHGVQRFAERFGGTAPITWRYDPIIPTVHDRRRFVALARLAADLGLHRLVVNFVAPPGRYKRVDARLKEILPGWANGMPDYTAAWRTEIASEILADARALGISVAVCAESHALAALLPGLGRAACGDYEWFAKLSGRRPLVAPSKGSRNGCGCALYFDVGYYGQWRRCHGCLYCYAG